MSAGMRGKTVVVTGATAGIGRRTALELAELGARVVVVGRNPDKTRGVVEALKQESGNPEVESLLAEFLAELAPARFDYVVIDCPNQISPLMETAIVPTDVFIVPIESTKAVASYANFFALVQRLRAPGSYRMLHVLNNISLTGVRNTILRFLEQEGIPLAQTEIRNCGWLAQVDRHGGSIFDYRPRSKGAEDIPKLQREVLASIRSTGKKAATA